MVSTVSDSVAPPGQETRLAPALRKLLLTVHVAATVSVLGADLVLLLLGIAGLRGAEPRTVYLAARLVGVALVAPLALASLGSGLLLGLLTPWGLLRYWWVTIKLGITVVLTIAVLFVLLPRLDAAANAAIGAEVHPLTQSERLPLAAAPAAASTLLALCVALAVFKPGWRLPVRGRRGAQRRLVERTLPQTERSGTW